jgi:hypothetical protein
MRLDGSLVSNEDVRLRIKNLIDTELNAFGYEYATRELKKELEINKKSREKQARPAWILRPVKVASEAMYFSSIFRWAIMSKTLSRTEAYRYAERLVLRSMELRRVQSVVKSACKTSFASSSLPSILRAGK